jgi:tetratricopeptide (TPR) repeat protein
MSSPLSSARRIAFAVITLAFPFLLLILVELSLRVFHSGQDLSLFATERVNGRTYHVMNPGVMYRYFPDGDFSPSTSVDDFAVPKPPGMYRIFCLGGSTTVGYPYWYNGSFSAYLRDRLRKIFPDRSIEVINVGMTATNSFTVVDMARDVVRYEPDLIIVYDGHNEFYGALGISSNQSPGKSRWVSRTYLRLLHFRSFVALREAYSWFTGLFRPPAGDVSRGTMMEKVSFGNYVPYGSATYLTALSTFGENLDEIRSLCANNAVPLILSTQVSNLRDQPPFISGSATADSTQGRGAFRTAFNRGLKRIVDGQMTPALAEFRATLLWDSLRADTHFQIARCLDALGDKGAARLEYIKARDYDQLRFRTSTDFNDAIRRDDGHNVIVLDMERVFQDNSSDSLIDNGLITEHLHPNSAGYFLMGKAFAETMRARHLLAPAEEWTEKDTVADAALWEERNVSTLDERIARRRTEILTGGWPFSNREIPVVGTVAQDDNLGRIAENVTRSVWDWLTAHKKAAELYEREGQLDSMAREDQVILSETPLDVMAYLKLAHVFLLERRYADMARLLRASQAVTPTILAARALGDFALRTGRPREAVAQYESMSAFEQSIPERVDNGYVLAIAYLKADMPEKARKQLQNILGLKPGYAPAAELLGRIKG